MANWHFWGEKEFSDVYENIYIRSVMEDWYKIIFEFVEQIASVKKKDKSLLDVGCGEGHTTKQILDRIGNNYECDLLEPNKHALATAEAFLAPENNIGECYPESLATFKPDKKYDVIITSHTNYYWALNKKDYDRQLNKLIDLLSNNGRLIILTLPENSDHYRIMLREIYPKFNHAEYIINFYKQAGWKVDVKKLRMRMFVGDILSTKKHFDLKVFYKFIHNTDAFPSDRESEEFLRNLKKCQKSQYLDFKDYMIVITK